MSHTVLSALTPEQIASLPPDAVIKLATTMVEDSPSGTAKGGKATKALPKGWQDIVIASVSAYTQPNGTEVRRFDGTPRISADSLPERGTVYGTAFGKPTETRVVSYNVGRNTRLYAKTIASFNDETLATWSEWRAELADNAPIASVHDAARAAIVQSKTRADVGRALATVKLALPKDVAKRTVADLRNWAAEQVDALPS